MTAPELPPLGLDQLIPDVVAWGVAVPADVPGEYIVVAEKSRTAAEVALATSAGYQDPDETYRLVYYHPDQQWTFSGTGRPVQISTLNP